MAAHITGFALHLESFLKKLGFSLADYQTTLPTLTTLVHAAWARLANSPFEAAHTFVGHSGGKDSVVVRYLADTTPTEYPTVHTPKFIGSANAVHVHTRDFLYTLNRDILYLPTPAQYERFGLKTQIDGTRIAESARDDGRSTTFVSCGNDVPRTELTAYVPTGLFGLQYIYPIYDWSDLQVWSLILSKDLPFSREYLL